MKHFDHDGDGERLHFLHANGYPPDCYKPLLQLLTTEYNVFGMLLRPLWGDVEPDTINDWTPFSDDLRRFLSSPPDPVIGVGHSIGATVTLRAALRDPGKFRALILIDPVLFLPRRMITWKIVRALGLGKRIHPKFRGALKRRRTFDNLEKVYRGYRNREVFRYMSDESLCSYIEGITEPSANGGYELVFSPEWEAEIYFTGLQDFDIWRDLPKLEVPTLFIRAEESDTFLEGAARLVKQKQPRARVETVPQSTHLLPLEHPKTVFDIMHSFLKEVV
jgi:pimeloyl-ACP methyl ester carboxylesterase